MSFASNRLAIEIEWGQCDPAGIMWNPRFFELFNQGTWMLFQRVTGVPPQHLTKHLGIFSFPLVEAGASFHAPLWFGDRAELISTLTEFKRSSFLVSHRILKDGKLCVDGKETRVLAGTHPDDPERMRAIPIPNDLIERFRVPAQ